MRLRWRLARATAKVTVRDGATGPQIMNIFAGQVSNPVAMTLVGDMNGSGSPELAILGDDGAGTKRVQIKDSITGAQVKTIDFLSLGNIRDSRRVICLVRTSK